MAAVEHHEVIVIGAGPGGMQMGYLLGKKNRDYVILERNANAGSTFEKYPRQRNLISINKKYTGQTGYELKMRWDWNSLLLEPEDRNKGLKQFTEYSDAYFPKADVLADYFRDFAREMKLNITYNSVVSGVRKQGETFFLTVNGSKQYSCKVLVCASGFRLPYLPDIPGIELVEHYDNMSVDREDFINQEVLVLGKGNSGFETADNLIPTTALIHICSPNPIKLAWKTHYVGSLRAVNTNLLDTYQLKSQNAVLDATPVRIQKTDDGKFAVDMKYTHAMGEAETLTYDRVLNCTGFRFDTSVFDKSCMPTLSYAGKFPKQDSKWESVNIPNLFFCGVLQHARDYKKTTTGFIHGFRYTARTLFHIIEERLHKTPYPKRPVLNTVDGLLKASLDRINTTSALYQQFGFMADLITTYPDGSAEYLEEITFDYVRDTPKYSQLERYFLVSLEFNKVEGDPFAINRAPVPDQAEQSIFLHPVVREYSKGKLQREIHILEDLFTDWTHPTQHIAPLRAFFEESFAAWAQKGGKTGELRAKM